MALAGSYFYTYRLDDVYAAKCQILLKSNETYNYQSELYKGLGFNSKFSSYEETASQMRVIKSTSLIDQVLNCLSLDVSYYIVGRLKSTEVYRHMPFVVHTNNRSEGSSEQWFDVSIIDTSHYELRYTYGDEEISTVFRFGELILDNGLYLKITKQPNLTQVSLTSLSKIDYAFKIHRKPSLISKYKSAIEVTNLDYTSIIELTLRDEIADRAVEVLDTLSRIYVENTLENMRQINENTLNYIDIQLNEVTGIINSIEQELEDFKQDASILNLSKEEESYFNRLVDMDMQMRAYRDEVNALADLTSYLLKDENEIQSWLAPNLFVSNSDPELAKQVKELYTLRSEFAQLLETKTESNPRVEEGLLRINVLKKDIIRYIESQKEAVESAMHGLEKEVDMVEGRIKNIPKTQRQIINIERRLAVNEELYSFLLSKRAETIIARAGIVPETKVIEKSRSVGIVYPDKLRTNLLATTMGFGLAILFVIVKELFFQKIKSLAQLQTVTNISILGSIPKKINFSSTYRILSGGERNDLAQSFRLLRTNLDFLGSDKRHKRVLVTSLLPGEGKTFTSLNLASVLAIASKRILLVDLDLHKPRVAKAMELPNGRGVSSILVGKMKVEDAIQKTDDEFLDVITSGPIPPNASELILGSKIEDLFSYAEEHYDYIFLDTPPVSLITDARVLMKHVDVKLFVLNSRSTSRTSIDYIEKLITTSEMENVALILNEEVLSKVDYYYSRYGYGGYGGYGSMYAQYGDLEED